MKKAHPVVLAGFRGFCVVVLMMVGLTAVEKAQGQAAPASEGSGRVHGTIANPFPAGHPFAGKMSLTADGKQEYIIPIDASGNFAAEVSPGRYDLSVHLMDNAPGVMEFKNVKGSLVIHAGEDLQLDFDASGKQHEQRAESSAATAPPPPPPAQDQTAPDAGGPGGDTGVIALPKKKEAPADTLPTAPAQPKVKNPEGLSNFSLHVDVSEVTVDVGVLLEKTHTFVPGLKPNNFKIYEDGVEQKVTGFRRTEAPITALLICEFAGSMNPYSYSAMSLKNDMRNGAFSFAQQLRPQDYVALMTYDMRTEIRLDFTQDKKELMEAINSLQVGGFSETNVFDALYEGIDRLERIEGRKYIILIGSGRDSMSKLTLDKILKKVKESRDITIYTISTGGFMRAVSEGRMGMGAQNREMDFLQADNEMRTFASLTGGASYFPKFQLEYGDDFAQINQNIRSKYELVYHPTNTKLDGSFRKLRVVLVDEEGQPLRMEDEKHKPLKYDIVARDGYKARQQVE
jgi:VWFA-related protein